MQCMRLTAALGGHENDGFGRILKNRIFWASSWHRNLLWVKKQARSN
jgi:hypothetical protein